jgi:hypothetical protein
MTWLTWRQFRIQAGVALAALAAFAVALAVTGPNLAHLYGISGIPACHTACGPLTDSFLHQARNGTTGTLYWLGLGVMFVVPAIIGVFWGAPLIAHELEAGTYRLAWNQSVTRTRWLAVKLLGVGLAGMATASLFSLAVTWWANPIDKAGMDRMIPQVFAARGIAPIGYAAFALTLGVTAGLLIRRTLPAMAITLAVIVAAQVATPFVRAHLMTPVHATVPLDTSAARFSITGDGAMTVTGSATQPGAWVLSNQSMTTTGRVFTGPADPTVCGPRASSLQTCIDWLNSLHLRQVVSYQPGSRFWAFQWYETTIFLALAALLAGFCFWWIRRRLT